VYNRLFLSTKLAVNRRDTFRRKCLLYIWYLANLAVGKPNSSPTPAYEAALHISVCLRWYNFTLGLLNHISTAGWSIMRYKFRLRFLARNPDNSWKNNLQYSRVSNPSWARGLQCIMDKTVLAWIESFSLFNTFCSCRCTWRHLAAH